MLDSVRRLKVPFFLYFFDFFFFFHSYLCFEKTRSSSGKSIVLKLDTIISISKVKKKSF